MMTNVTIILFEETVGPHATDSLALVYLLNLPWFSIPIVLMWRMWSTTTPFTREATEGGASDGARAIMLDPTRIAHLDSLARTKLVPDLWVVDTESGLWMKARDTCTAPSCQDCCQRYKCAGNRGAGATAAALHH